MCTAKHGKTELLAQLEEENYLGFLMPAQNKLKASQGCPAWLMVFWLVQEWDGDLSQGWTCAGAQICTQELAGRSSWAVRDKPCSTSQERKQVGVQQLSKFMKSQGRF